MRSSRPDISAPLSRTKKNSRGTFAAILAVVVSIAAVVFVFLTYSTINSVQQNNQGAKIGHLGKTASKKKGRLIHEEEKHQRSPEEEDRHLRTHPLGKTGATSKQETLLLRTKHGNLKIVLRPDLSPESVMYIKDIVSASCDRCVFYRAEKPGIFQGMIKSETVPKVATKGQCPEAYREKKQACPPHDPQCACHGPTMTRGMVGWAGGATGPDFFIDSYLQPAKFWGQQHTVWGEIEDKESFDVLDTIYALPVTKRGGMLYLDENIQFTMEIV